MSFLCEHAIRMWGWTRAPREMRLGDNAHQPGQRACSGKMWRLQTGHSLLGSLGNENGDAREAERVLAHALSSKDVVPLPVPLPFEEDGIVGIGNDPVDVERAS